jgi:hypothetical protein
MSADKTELSRELRESTRMEQQAIMPIRVFPSIYGWCSVYP